MSLRRLLSSCRAASTRALRVTVAFFCACTMAVLLAACGGSGGGGGGGGGGGVAPTITTPPASVSVVAGAAATFTVVAAGDAPLGYQWQRNGTAIAAATAASYTTPATTVADSGAAYRVVVTNPFGTATSNAATLTVNAAPPVLTITAQPADASVVAGVSASFSVAATCSSGALSIQWQRNGVDIAGATAATYTLATVLADSGALFRAQLACSGLAATTSRAALLTVTAPASVTLALLPVNGLRDQAEISHAAGIVQDASGSFTFLTTNRIKRLSADLLTITPVAGGGAPAGAADGAADVARFDGPQGIAEAADGTLYVTDTNNNTIRKITPAGQVSTLAGTAGVAGAANGTGAAASFNTPIGIVLGPDGDLYVADSGNHLIRRVTAAGVVTTYAGGTSGFADGAALTARFTLPRGLAVAGNGDLYVADYGTLRIRVVTRSGGSAGSVSTLAGTGMNANGTPDGAANVASIPFPSSIVLAGNLLTFTDESALLRQLDITTGITTTFAGTRFLGNTPFYADGAPGKGYLHAVHGITPVAAGGFLVSDTDSLRTVSTTGVVRTIASASQQVNATAAGIGTLPQIQIYQGPDTRQAVTVDPAGNVDIADAATRLVRRIAPSGAVTLAAGFPGVSTGLAIDGTANEAQFISIAPIASDNAGVLYVTDNHAVRRIGTDNVVTLLAGSYSATGSTDGTATTARFFDLRGIAVGPSGNVFVSDDRVLRKIDTSGNVTTYAGVAGQFGDVDGANPSVARFQAPSTLAIAPDGKLYVVDGSVIRTVSADGTTVSRLSVVDVVGGLAVGADGTVYYGSATGLASISTGGVRTLLIPKGPATVLGPNPTLLYVVGIAVLGPKRLLIQTGFDRLIATLP